MKFVMDASFLGGANFANRKGKAWFPHIYKQRSGDTFRVDEPVTRANQIMKIQNPIFFDLNTRQSEVLMAVIQLGRSNGITYSHDVTYKQIKQYLDGHVSSARGIRASCRAIYKRGFIDIHALVIRST